MRMRVVTRIFCPVMALWTLCATAAAQSIAPAPPPPEEPWYEALDFGLFADAYASVNTNLPKPHEGSNTLRAYDQNNGFSLSWAGADVSYSPAPVGGAVSLRFGPTAEAYADSCASENTRCDAAVPGLTFVKQAYAAWKPLERLTIDFGKFDTIYGAEVAESQNNLNYTRGAVYWLLQPLFHTGLRAELDIIPELSIRTLVVNGWNNTIDNNIGKTYGVQAVARPIPEITATLGWLGGPEQDDSASIDCPEGTYYFPDTGACDPVAGAPAGTYVVDRGDANQPEAWRHLVDLVVAWQPTPALELVANGDFDAEGVRSMGPDLETRVDTQYAWGAMLGSRLALTEVWSVGARAEYVSDLDGFAVGVNDLRLVTGTLTLQADPTPNLRLTLEGRGDFAIDGGLQDVLASPSEVDDEKNDIFPAEVRDDVDHQVTVVLGVVARL